MTDPKTYLPIFPLNLVVFPTEDLNLHIFEPRYKQLITDCFEQDLPFGIPPYINDKIKSIGTQLKVAAIEKKYPDGKMDIKTKAFGLFQIVNIDERAPGKLYSRAEVKFLDYDEIANPDINRTILSLLKRLFECLNLKRKLPEDLSFSTYSIAKLVGFNLEQEYEFLSTPEEHIRQTIMLRHLEQMIPAVENMEKIRKQAQMNGHFRDIIPPNV